MRTEVTGLARLRFLLGALLVAACLAPSAVAAPSAAGTAAAGVECTPGAAWGVLRQDMVPSVLALVNADRARLGLSQLTISPILTDSASWKALHMARYGYMTHDDPAPPIARTVADRLSACGFPAQTASWGENLAWGYANPLAVFNAWLASSGHRENIERPVYNLTGIAVAVSWTGTFYWAQEFGSTDAPPPAAPPPAQSPQPQPAPQPEPAPLPPLLPGGPAAGGTPPPTPTPTPSPEPATPAAPAAPAAPATGTPSSPPAPKEPAPTTGASGGSSTLSVSLAAPTALRILRISTEPPLEGGRLAAWMTVVSSPSGRRVTKGAVVCRAAMGRESLRAVLNGFTGGEAACAWAVPRRSAGRVIKTVVTVKAGARQVASRSTFIVGR